MTGRGHCSGFYVGSGDPNPGLHPVWQVSWSLSLVLSREQTVFLSQKLSHSSFFLILSSHQEGPDRISDVEAWPRPLLSLCCLQGQCLAAGTTGRSIPPPVWSQLLL